MTTQTKQTMSIANTTTIKDEGEVISSMNFEKTVVNLQEFQHVREILTPNNSTFTVDFGDFVPTYVKLVTDKIADFHISMTDDTDPQNPVITTIIMKNSTYFELSGTVSYIEVHLIGTEPTSVDVITAI